MSESVDKIEAVTIKQVDAAKRYGVTDRTIRNWDRRGLIVGNRVRGLKFYPVKDLDRLTLGKRK